MLDSLFDTYQHRHRYQSNWSAYVSWRQNYAFDMVLDYNDFSYLLEGFCKSGYIRVHDANASLWEQSPMLSLPLTHLVYHFSQRARAMPADDWPSYANVASIFVQLVKSTIACAKYDPSTEGEAARHLLAFLLHHNIHVQHGSEVVTMHNAFLSEASYAERCAFSEGSNAHPCRFIYSEWQQLQHYPGKGDIEDILNVNKGVPRGQMMLNQYSLVRTHSSPQFHVTAPAPRVLNQIPMFRL